MNQLGIPVPASPEEISRKKTFGQSIILCAELGGKEPKELAYELNSDKGQVSRWQNDQEGISYKKLKSLMGICGNDAPFLWIGHDLGYDITSFRKRESETEKLWREAEERAAQAEKELQVLRKYVGALK